MHGCPVSHLDSKSLRAELRYELYRIPAASGEACSQCWLIPARCERGVPGETCTRACCFPVCLMILPSLSLLPPSLFSTASPLTPPVPSLVSGLSPAGVCSPVCVEVPSETEAVQGNPMKLRCISCMKREDVEATTVVEWFYRPEGGKDFLVGLTADSALCFRWPLPLCAWLPTAWGMTI